MTGQRPAAIVTIGSELTEGLRIDTNSAVIARELSRRGFLVTEMLSVGDDANLLAQSLARLADTCELVVTTGGLGPTHDDITREAAAVALGVDLALDDSIVDALRPVQARYGDPAATEAILTQALVLDGAEVLPATTGTAPGQVVATRGGLLVLLPGPPGEMRPMLLRSLERFVATRSEPRELGVVGLPESAAQRAAQLALGATPGITLTILAKPGDVRVLLIDVGAGEVELGRAADAVAAEIGEACYSTDGTTLAEALLNECLLRNLTVATAESCTGGMVSAAITDVPGSSAALLGGVVSYANAVKSDVLSVPAEVILRSGAVSEDAACAMADGVRLLTGADLAVAVTGVAGPDGGTAEKPIGLVWFAVATPEGTTAVKRRFAGGNRESIRARATSTALDLLRRAARVR